jgi:xanthine phosphoribosyltransferase
MNVPVVFGKKASAKNLSDSVYVADIYSFTHKKSNSVAISKEYLTKEDKILIVDDFLANGEAIRGLINICNQANAKVVGCAIAIEKGFQGGGDKLRSEGVRVDSLAIIDEMTDTSIKFREI